MQSTLTEVTDIWESVEATWKKRQTELEEVHEISIQFHTSYDALVLWLTDMEQKLDELPPVGTELDTVKEQLHQEKVWRFALFELSV